MFFCEQVSVDGRSGKSLVWKWLSPQFSCQKLLSNMLPEYSWTLTLIFVWGNSFNASKKFYQNCSLVTIPSQTQSGFPRATVYQCHLSSAGNSVWIQKIAKTNVVKCYFFSLGHRSTVMTGKQYIGPNDSISQMWLINSWVNHYIFLWSLLTLEWRLKRDSKARD